MRGFHGVPVPSASRKEPHASVLPTQNKGEYEVTLQVAPTAAAGDVDGKVTIYTNDKVTPVVTVPVKGTIKMVTPTASK